MAYIIKSLYRLLEEAIREHMDPRVQHLPLVGNPFHAMAIVGVYLALVLYYGPKWMENRPPYNLKNILRVYNAVQVILNTVLFIYGVKYSYWRKDFSLICQPLDQHNTEPWMQKLLLLTYGYYLMKYLDLLDTIFFVLRKKNSHITFLHVYHHAGMILATYIFTTFIPGSHSTMLGVINLFVHIVMYGYYFLTSVRPLKQSLWLKKRITQLQMLQFGYLVFHFLMPILYNTCQHPEAISFIGLIQALFMFTLFFDFYYKAYVRKELPVSGTACESNKTEESPKARVDECTSGSGGNSEFGTNPHRKNT